MGTDSEPWICILCRGDSLGQTWSCTGKYLMEKVFCYLQICARWHHSVALEDTVIKFSLQPRILTSERDFSMWGVSQLSLPQHVVTAASLSCFKKLLAEEMGDALFDYVPWCVYVCLFFSSCACYWSLSCRTRPHCAATAALQANNCVFTEIRHCIYCQT